MENLSKKNIFTTPDGYFKELPDRILDKRIAEKPNYQFYLTRAAAAVFLFLGLAFVLWRLDLSNNFNLEANVSEEVDLYINAGHWQAEDILLLADNPNAILDDIIKAEWGAVNEDSEIWDEDLWF